jgi:hypothetical protein
MSFHQYLEYKALNRIYVTSNEAITELVLRDPETSEKLKAQTKNVCALISLELFEDFEAICGLLEISKRKFIEGALIEAIENANKIVKEVGLLEHYASLSDKA